MSFAQESSFGGDAFSFFPDLLGLALAFGSFGSRGFGLLGLGLNLLGSGFGSDGGYGGGFGGYGYSGGYVACNGFGGYVACGGPVWTPGLLPPPLFVTGR